MARTSLQYSLLVDMWSLGCIFDGFAAQYGPTRNNAHDIDLNRDFPDQFFPQNNNEEKRQAETRAIMNWIRSTRFTASASFHEGALVANYPWDGNHDVSQNYASSPDDSTFKYLAGVYAKNHPLMFKNKEFVGGVTNGAAWYPLYGGMQDWNYLHGNCLELTLEMNDQKWPPPTQIPQIWREHRKSMLELVAATATSGVHGRVMSSKAQPLAASISVTGISHTMNASAEFGDYHRLLEPGHIYEVTASMAGYTTSTNTIFLPNNSSVTLDFILEEEKATAIVTKPAPAEMVVMWIPRKELQRSMDGLGSSVPLRLVYVLPLVSIAAVAVMCLFLASRRSSRNRQRLSRV